MPATTRVSIHWEPDPVVFADALAVVEAALGNRLIPMQLAKETVQADIRERFETATSPDGTPWEPWSENEPQGFPSYRERAEAYPNIGLLRQDDELYEAASGDNAFVVNNDTLFYAESSLPSAGWAHQEGAPHRRTSQGTANPLVARPFLGLSNEARQLIFVTFNDWFDKAIDLYETVTSRVGRRHAMKGAGGRFIPRSSPMPTRIGR